MLSDSQDAPLVVRMESFTMPQPVKWIINEPVNTARADGVDEYVEESSSNAETLFRTQSKNGTALHMAMKGIFRSSRPLTKCRKRALYEALVDENNGSDEANGSAFNQLVLYNPAISKTTQDILPMSYHSEHYTSTLQNLMASNPSQRVLPSVGAFTVQCATCFKWRLIPTKEKYEEIRERILERPFTCEQAREWRPNITCDDPEDISQDGSRLWAIDKPSIAQPPPGWERQLRIRAEGGTKFADVYYAAPSGKKLRSMVEVQKYLLEHPEYVEHDGVKLSQFSFQIPKPMQENYVRKRHQRMPDPLDGGLGRSLEPEDTNPISWIAPLDEDQDHYDPPLLLESQPMKKKGTPVDEDQDRYHSLLLESQQPLQPVKKKGTKPKAYIKTSGTIPSSVLEPALRRCDNFL